MTHLHHTFMRRKSLGSLFYIGLLLLVLFEAARVYFIMPLPGSQRMRSIDVAYWLHTWRWTLRLAFAAIAVVGLSGALRGGRWRKIVVPLALALTGIAAYGGNVTMSADRIFIAPASLDMEPVERNRVEMARLVVGIELGGDARAYPVQFIGYHHQVRDVVAGQPVLVSFCTVCRTGRVFRPIVRGKVESFRLVGMDHFNAMFEGARTGSWWRQANGEAIAGPLAGDTLPEIPSRQVMLAQWLALHWNRLVKETAINDVLGGKPIVLALAADKRSYFAFVRPDSARMTVRHDSLVAGPDAWAFTGRGATAPPLEPINASQEFWHSWRTFQPETGRY